VGPVTPHQAEAAIVEGIGIAVGAMVLLFCHSIRARWLPSGRRWWRSGSRQVIPAQELGYRHQSYCVMNLLTDSMRICQSCRF
jgi:hypothetical protein